MSEFKSTCVIFNPDCGSRPDGELLRHTIDQALPGAELRSASTTADPEKLAAEALADGFETIVAAGGDGTLNAVMNGLRADFSKAQLGLLPLGTGNDFARTIGIPTEIGDALSMLRAGYSQRVDLIRVQTSQTRYCINVSAGGFSTKVSEKMTEELKGAWGPLSYVRSFFEALPELSDHKTEILLDDSEMLETPCYSIIVANARYVAHGIPIAPEANITDGLADIVIVPTATVPALAVLAPQMLLGKHLTSELIQFRRARKIAVRTNPPMTFNVDGEVIGDEPATFEVIPSALRVITAPAS